MADLPPSPENNLGNVLVSAGSAAAGSSPVGSAPAGSSPVGLTPAGLIPAGIAEEILAEGGRVTFARFMELALTHPTEGYYCRTHEGVGWRGDFSTAPALSPDFNQALSRLVEELVDGALAAGGEDGAVTVVELGPGGGEFAEDMLAGWEVRRPDLRQRVSWLLVEVGPRLREKQRRVLLRLVRTGWKVEWADTVEAAFAAQSSLSGNQARVVVSNEFVDALPVHVVRVEGSSLLEAYVEVSAVPARAQAEAPAWEVREVWQGLSPQAEAELEFLFGTTDPSELLAWTRDGVLELRPAVGALLEKAASGASGVCMLTVDYGEAFASSLSVCRRGEGMVDECAGGGMAGSAGVAAPLYGRTLRAFFRHQRTSDLYARVGWQDLTADVDFRALDRHGRATGFETILFVTVADLLRAHGAEEQLQVLVREAGKASGRALEADRRASILAALLDRDGLGGSFRVMLQVREGTGERGA